MSVSWLVSCGSLLAHIDLRFLPKSSEQFDDFLAFVLLMLLQMMRNLIVKAMPILRAFRRAILK